MFITVLGVCGVRVLWVYTVFTIPKYHTLDSLYLSYIISWTIALLAELVAYAILMSRARKSQEQRLLQQENNT